MEKKRFLNYELMHHWLWQTVQMMVDEDAHLSVKEVAERASVAVSTAYKHQVQDMILKAIKEADGSNNT